MRFPILLATILILLGTQPLPRIPAGEVESPRPQKPREQLLQSIEELRDEVRHLNERLAEVERLLKSLQAEPQSAESQAAISSRRDKYEPRRYWDSLSDSAREKARAAEKAATKPLREWRLSDHWTVHDVAVSSDNRTVLAGGERGEWRLCDIKTGEVYFAEEHPDMRQVQSVGLSPDGETLALDSEKGLYLLCRQHPEEERILSLERSICAVDFSPDGKLIAVAAPKGTVLVLRSTDFTVVHEIQTGADVIKDLRFTDDGRRIATSGGYFGNQLPAEDSADGLPTSGLWDIVTGLPLFSVPADKRGATTLVAEIVPGQSLLVVNMSDAKVWNIPERKSVLTISERGDYVADVNVDGTVLLLPQDSERMALYEVKTGRVKKTLQIPSHWRFNACLSPNGRYVVAGGWDGGIRVWEVE